MSCRLPLQPGPASAWVHCYCDDTCLATGDVVLFGRYAIVSNLHLAWVRLVTSCFLRSTALVQTRQ